MLNSTGTGPICVTNVNTISVPPFRISRAPPTSIPGYLLPQISGGCMLTIRERAIGSAAGTMQCANVHIPFQTHQWSLLFAFLNLSASNKVNKNNNDNGAIHHQSLLYFSVTHYVHIVSVPKQRTNNIVRWVLLNLTKIENFTMFWKFERNRSDAAWQLS